MTLTLGIFLAAAAACLLIVVYTAITGLMPVPTSRAARSAMLAALPPEVRGTIVELGSGWGGLTLVLAERYPESRVFGYELSPLPWLTSRLRQTLARQSNLVLRRQDFFQVALADVSLAICFLFPGGMEQLKAKLQAELAPGALVVSNTHPVPGWEPTRILRVEDQFATRIYLYRMTEAAGDRTQRARPG
jgi:trans-aconitate methyltransferase